MKMNAVLKSAAAARRDHHKAVLAGKKTHDEPDQLCESISGYLASGELKPEELSIRDVFLATVPGGSEILESWRPGGKAENLHALDHQSLMESGATLSSAFSHITGQMVYNAVMEKYEMPELVFSKLVTAVPTQFNGERIPGVTRLGNTFESIGENQPYPIAGLGEDWIDTPQTVKRGELVPLSREAIFFDRTGLLVARAQELGEFYGVNKEIRIIDAVIDENVTAHRYKWKDTVYASFQTSTPWINQQGSSTLVDYTDIDSAELLLSNLVDPHTGLPIMITPKHLIVTRQLQATALNIIQAVQVRIGDGASSSVQTLAPTPLKTNYSLVTSPHLAARMATDTSWFIGDIGKAVKYMQNWPMEITQAPSNSEVEFTHDIVQRWKVSERGAAAVVEPRALIKSVVA